MAWYRFTILTALAVAAAACDHGFEPPAEPLSGVVAAEISYVGHPEAWPPQEQLQELLFVAMRFIPQDTTDFLQLNRMIFSEGLQTNVAGQSVVIPAAPTGAYPYSGVAQKFGADAFAWRPVGLVESNGGVFYVAPGETTFVSVRVDFTDPPPFPPSQ